MKDRIDQLRFEIARHDHLYYVMGRPEIPDNRYDVMFRTLVDLENQYPEFYDANSPTARVGSDLRNDFPTVQHLTPMLSVNAIETVPELEAFLNNHVSTVCQLKYDGCGISLIYKYGQLFKALTRGDGFKGMDVTDNIRTLRDIPFTVNTVETIEVRGEVWCPYSELKRLQDLGEEVNSPVAVASNTIKMKQSNAVANRRLRFTAFHCEGLISTPLKSHSQTLLWLRDNHFNTPETFDTAFILRSIRYNCALAPKLPNHSKDIPADGIIFKYNDLSTCQREGANSRAVNWSVAWKFDKDIFDAEVISVGGKVALNGLVTPLVFIKPIKINNEVITKIPVNAADLDTGLAIGDTIQIRRKGTRVAQLVREQKVMPQIPHFCPQCSTPLIRRKSLLSCPNCVGEQHLELPANENYNHSCVTDTNSFSADPALIQKIAHRFFCRLIPTELKSRNYTLHYNDVSQIADIAFALGKYARKFQHLR
jgi:DNA ligase (NAD+)